MSVVPLEGELGLLTEAGVASMRVVPALDEVEDGHSGLGLDLEAVLVEELALEGGEEALAESVVVGVADGAHGGTHAGMLASEAEGDGSVLGGFNGSTQQCCHLFGRCIVPERLPRAGIELHGYGVQFILSQGCE